MNQLCRVCGKTSSFHCGKCRSANYCGLSCQKKDWTRSHIKICSHLAYIAGKRKRGEDCLNEDDPISLDSLAEIENPDEILKIGPHCFHLSPLYNWVINEENNLNPLTNEPFSPEEVDLIREKAMEVFPLTVKIKMLARIIHRDRTIKSGDVIAVTTSLVRIEQLLALIFASLYDRDPDATLYQSVNFLAGSGTSYKLSSTDDDITAVSVIIRDHHREQIYEQFPGVNELSLFYLGITSPYVRVKQLEELLDWARAMDKPTRIIEQDLQRLQGYLDLNERRVIVAQHRRALLRARAEEIGLFNVPDQPPSTLKVRVSIQQGLLDDLGTFVVYVPDPGYLRDLLDVVRERLRIFIDIVDIPENLNAVYFNFQVYHEPLRLIGDIDGYNFGEDQTLKIMDVRI